MSARWRGTLAAAAIAVLTAALAWGFWPRHGETSFWLCQASPGPLAAARAFLEGDCAACHDRVQSVPQAQCIACHADEKALLQRQPTSFHATVGACAECHKEHRGREVLLARMDREALARIGLARLPLQRAVSSAGNPAPGALEATLDCASCHATKDRHRGLFGKDCAACHATAKWTLADFRHPSPASRECAQCHQAPPSRCMEHFAMVSQRVARQEHAQVRECFLCHRTTSWNDINGVGYYKHH